MDYKKLLKKDLSAPLWKRGLAYLVDMVIVGVVVVLPLEPTLEGLSQGSSFFGGYSFLQSNPHLALKLLVLSLAIALLTVLYWAILEYKLRQSVGKLLLGIKVVSTKKTFTFSQCFVRNITKFTSLFLLLDVLYMLFKGGNQRYTEVLSKTEVLVGGTNGKV